MRFLQGMSIAETADVLGRSAGAVRSKLQLRAVRNLAALLPDGAALMRTVTTQITSVTRVTSPVTASLIGAERATEMTGRVR